MPQGEAVKRPEHLVGFWPTPAEWAARLVELAAPAPGMRVLEPQMGEAHLARAIREAVPTAQIEGVEINEIRAAKCRAAGFDCTTADFLAMTPEPRYARVILNPPFEDDAAIAHVRHGLRFLDAGGRLVAVMPEAVRWAGRAAVVAFRELLASTGAQVLDNPAGAFASEGTNVSTVTVVIDAPGTAPAAPAQAQPAQPVARAAEPARAKAPAAAQPAQLSLLAF